MKFIEHSNNEVLTTMQAMKDCFEIEKTIIQHHQLCSSINPASVISRFLERDNSGKEELDEKVFDDEIETAELHFEIKDLEFRRDHSVGHESFRTKTNKKPNLNKTISSELYPHVKTTDSRQKRSSSAEVLHVQTLLEEQLKDQA